MLAEVKCLSVVLAFAYTTVVYKCLPPAQAPNQIVRQVAPHPFLWEGYKPPVKVVPMAEVTKPVVKVRPRDKCGSKRAVWYTNKYGKRRYKCIQ